MCVCAHKSYHIQDTTYYYYHIRSTYRYYIYIIYRMCIHISFMSCTLLGFHGSDMFMWIHAQYVCSRFGASSKSLVVATAAVWQLFHRCPDVQKCPLTATWWRWWLMPLTATLRRVVMVIWVCLTNVTLTIFGVSASMVILRGRVSRSANVYRRWS